MAALVATQWGTLVQLRAAAKAERPMDEAAARRLLEIVTAWGATAPAGDALDDLRASLSEEQITRLLDHEASLVRACAIRALSAVGQRGCLEALLARLFDRAPSVRRLADGAIQTIWFRLGTPEANGLLATARRAMVHGRTFEALEAIEGAIRDSPGFAEAYNQRAKIYFHERQYALSAIDCEKALSLMPRHYGAMAGLGRCLLRLDQEVAALAAFTLAKSINPNLELDAVIAAVRRRLNQRPSAI